MTPYQIISPAAINIRAGTTYTYQIQTNLSAAFPGWTYENSDLIARPSFWANNLGSSFYSATNSVVLAPNLSDAGIKTSMTVVAYAGGNMIAPYVAELAVSINVLPPVLFTSKSVAYGNVADAFSYQIGHSPTDGACLFLVQDLPPGLTLVPGHEVVTGASPVFAPSNVPYKITGTPTSPGTYTVTIIGVPPSNNTWSMKLTIVIQSIPHILSPNAVTAVHGQPLKKQIVTDVAAVITTTDTLPLGLALVNGYLSGTVDNSVADGQYTIHLTATNSYGATSSTLTINVATAPSITSGDGFLAALTDVSINRPITASDPAATISAVNLPSGLSFAANTITGSVAAAGTYVIGIAATKSGLSSSSNLTLQIDLPLAITNAASITAVAGTTFSLDLTANNADCVFSGTNLPAWAQVTGNKLIGTAQAPGVYSLNIHGDSQGVTSSDQTIVLTSTPPPIINITSSSTASGRVGSVFSYAITGDQFIVSSNATGLPLGLTFSGTAISGTPQESGIFAIPISATGISRFGEDNSASETIVITIANQQITSASQEYFELLPSEYEITSDSVFPLTYTASGLPPGMTLLGNKISGTPTAGGTYT